MSNPNLEGIRSLILGGICKSLGNLETSLEHFRNAMKVSDRDFEDGHIAPYACYEMSMILLDKPETKDKGVELLKHSKDAYEGYDFENRLQMRIHATEHRLLMETK